ncbi:MAG TPA: hypothetical protein PLN53_08885 [Terricaulis sp.]|nr:hypothetical protein [Terricaulis sp.]
MRHFALIFIALALSACGQPQRAAEGDCTLSAARELTWPEGDARLTATASSIGACDNAVLTLEIVGSDAANAVTAPYATLVPSGDNVARADVQRFLDSWVDITPMRASALPAWNETMSRPGEGVEALPYASPLPRSDYEALRARNAPAYCIAEAAAAVTCYVVDNDGRALRAVLGYGA